MDHRLPLHQAAQMTPGRLPILGSETQKLIKRERRVSGGPFDPARSRQALSTSREHLPQRLLGHRSGSRELDA